MKDLARLTQIVEELNGERGSNRVIRQNDLVPIAQYELKSAQLTGVSVSVSDYNALQKDVKALHDAMVRISNLYGTAK
jgi:hypothetical protein